MRLNTDVLLNRFPFKHVADGLSVLAILLLGDRLQHQPLSFGKRLSCARFFFNGGNVSRIHACLPRSGSIWSELGMRLAIDLADGGDGEYTYDNGPFFPRDGLSYRRLDWRVPTGQVNTMYRRKRGPALGPVLYYQSRHPYYRIRSARLKRMKIVVLTRSILDSLESRYVKFSMVPTRPEVTLEDEASFDWIGTLDDNISFFNSWGDVLTWHPAIRHYRYEDLKENPVELHKDILDFWGFDVPEDCVAEGFRRVTKVEMRKRMPSGPDAINIRAVSRSKQHRGAISEPLKRRIIDRIKKKLIYPLGYTYDYDTPYGREYD